MKRLAFWSTINGWGGSELLWYACARLARRDGAAVYAPL